MGMFDSLYIDSEMLPVSKEEQKALSGVEFQTKSMECNLDTYQIEENGDLTISRYNWDKKEKDSGIKVLHHGYIYFYGSSGDRRGTDYKWYEFTAKFTDGRLVEITKNENNS